MKNIIQASAVAAVLITGAMAPAAAGGNDSFREICGNDIQFDSIQIGRDNYQSIFLCGHDLDQASSTWGIGSKEVIHSTGFGHRGNTSIEGNAVQLFQLQEGFGHRFDLDSIGSFNSFDSRQKGALHRSTHFNRGHDNHVFSVQEGVGHTSETRTFGSNIRVNVYQGNQGGDWQTLSGVAGEGRQHQQNQKTKAEIMNRLRNTMLAISAILLSIVGTAQAEVVNVHINSSKDVVVHSLGMSSSGRTILNVPDCGPFALETFAGRSGYGVAEYTSCGRNYVLEFLHGELISFHVTDVRQR